MTTTSPESSKRDQRESEHPPQKHVREIQLDPDADEERLLLKLGAALSLIWPDLSTPLREALHAQANAITLPARYGAVKRLGTHEELSVWLESCRLKHF